MLVLQKLGKTVWMVQRILKNESSYQANDSLGLWLPTALKMFAAVLFFLPELSADPGILR